MTIYLIMFALPLFFSFYASRFEKNLENLVWLLVGILYVFIIGLRHEIGVDWEAYKVHYDSIADSPLLEALQATDPAYAFINWTIAKINGEVYTVNFICAIIFIFGLIKFCRSMPAPWMAMLIAQPILIIIVGMSYTRQSAAVGFELLALVAIMKGNNRLFILNIICGALFHKTAIFLLPIVAVVSNKNRILMILSIIALGIGFAYVLIADNIDDTIELYVVQKLSSDGGLYRIALNILPAILIFIYAKRKLAEKAHRNLWRSFAVLSFLLFPLISVAPTATDRLVMYLTPIQIFVFSNIQGWFKSNFTKFYLLAFIVTFYTLLLIVWLSFGNYKEYWVPYRMFPFI
jgi:hypothetical protein